MVGVPKQIKKSKKIIIFKYQKLLKFFDMKKYIIAKEIMAKLINLIIGGESIVHKK
tara:strand:+ start:324 stop:491 length:168 start_codon:yes stop_codon:yes gene_type:complete